MIQFIKDRVDSSTLEAFLKLVDQEAKNALLVTSDPRKRELLKQRRAAVRKELDSARRDEHGEG